MTGPYTVYFKHVSVLFDDPEAIVCVLGLIGASLARL